VEVYAPGSAIVSTYLGGTTISLRRSATSVRYRLELDHHELDGRSDHRERERDAESAAAQVDTVAR
jgi:hypothetical protein